MNDTTASDDNNRRQIAHLQLSIVTLVLSRAQNTGPLYWNDMNNWIGPTVKHVWNNAMYVLSVTRLGDFGKFFLINYLLKGAQMFGDFWGVLKTLKG